MRAIYACRMCKKRYVGVEGNNKDQMLKGIAELAISGCSRIAQFPTLIDGHICDNGSIGIADFIGFASERRKGEGL